MKFLPFPLKHGLLIGLFFGVLALALLAPIASNTLIPGTADFINHLAAIIQAKMALIEGQFPLRVAPFERSGWRYPLYQFSSPTSYGFAGLIYYWVTPQNPLLAYKITLWLALTVGGIYLYRLALWLTGSKAASLLAGAVYLTAPYYIILVDRWGGFNEAIAQSIIPAACFYTLRRYYQPAKQALLLQTALAWYLLATTHLVTFVYSSLFIALIILIDAIKARPPLSHLVRAGIGYALGCLMAAWFLTPIALLSHYFKIDSTLLSPSLYNSFSPLAGLLSAASVSPMPLEGTFRPISSPPHPAIGWPILIAAGVCCYALLDRWPLKNKQGARWVLPLLLTFLLACFLSWSPVNIWAYLPKLLVIAQYCWRLLGQVIWLGALLFALALCWLFRNRVDARHVVAGLLLIGTATSSWLPFLGKASITLNELIKKPHIGFSRNDYLIDYNKHPEIIDTVDNLLLESAMTNGVLTLDSDILIPRALLKFAFAPFMHIEGLVPDEAALQHAELIVHVNGAAYLKFPLKPGPLLWNIPLKNLPLSSDKFFKLQFKIKPASISLKPSTRPLAIPIKNVTLTGFLDPNKTLLVSQTQPHCKQEGTLTVCKMFVPKKIKLVELPIIFYPELLDIKLNGHAVSAKAVLYLYYAIAGITPEPLKENTIEIRFRGLAFANWISLACWGLWLLTLLNVAREYFRRQEKIISQASM